MFLGPWVSYLLFGYLKKRGSIVYGLSGTNGKNAYYDDHEGEARHGKIS